MHITNLHTHTNYCDGNNTAEQMIIAAINSNMQSIGISTHGPTPFVSDWNLQNDQIDAYIKEILSLKKKYEYTINVFLGMELDYIGDLGFSYLPEGLIDRLDYYIGSVHYLGTFNDGIKWTVDYDLDELLRGIDESFKGNRKIAVEKYYEFISEMAVKYEPPVIGHLDLFKKNNKNNVIFDENEDWYIKTVERCLDVIKNTSSVIEINTGGIARKFTDEQYPSTFILKMIKEKDIPIMINSDAHSIDCICCCFDEMYKLVYDLGFKKLSYLSKDGWKTQSFTMN